MKKYLVISLAIFLGLAVFLRLVFSGVLILPQTFNIGPLVIHYYGLIMALAAASGFYLAIKRSVLYGLDKKIAEDILFWVIVGGFVGARIYHVLSSAGYYYQHPVDIFKVWNGGLSIYGAVLGGILTLIILHKILNLSAGGGSASGGKSKILNLLDWLAPSVVLGQIIGRFGNLFNYEAFGYPTNLPWKMFVEKSFRPVKFQSENFFHPWFLYEVLGNLVILIFLLKIVEPKLKKSSPGLIAFFYLLLYNSLRFALEFLRIDSTFVGGFRLNAIVSLIIALTGLVGLIYVARKRIKTS
jgi:phosphatidylglycerol:prolipoprotein diacylglycerol transferase